MPEPRFTGLLSPWRWIAVRPLPAFTVSPVPAVTPALPVLILIVAGAVIAGLIEILDVPAVPLTTICFTSLAGTFCTLLPERATISLLFFFQKLTDISVDWFGAASSVSTPLLNDTTPSGLALIMSRPSRTSKIALSSKCRVLFFMPVTSGRKTPHLPANLRYQY